MKEPRRPAAFRMDPTENRERSSRPKDSARKPAAIKDLDTVEIVLAEIDALDEEAATQVATAGSQPRRRRGIRWGSILLSTLATLLLLAFGLWTERLIRDLFSRSEWLGWGTAMVSAIAVLALLGLLLRELHAIARLRSVSRLQRQASQALAANDASQARTVVTAVAGFLADNPATAAGRRKVASLEGDIIDGADLIRIAEKELLAGLDREARKIVMNSAKRVSVVTALSPRALVDVAFVLFEMGRMIRRLSRHYGGRPGGLGFIRLVRDVVGHLALTGTVAVGDSLVQQLVGHGLAARLSARLGEGVINGLMTVRVGIAAIETVRPLPFAAVRRPSMGDFLPGLTGSANLSQRNKA